MFDPEIEAVHDGTTDAKQAATMRRWAPGAMRREERNVLNSQARRCVSLKIWFTKGRRQNSSAFPTAYSLQPTAHASVLVMASHGMARPPGHPAHPGQGPTVLNRLALFAIAAW
jgi:hypothetical protein